MHAKAELDDMSLRLVEDHLIWPFFHWVNILLDRKQNLSITLHLTMKCNWLSRSSHLIASRINHWSILQSKKYCPVLFNLMKVLLFLSVMCMSNCSPLCATVPPPDSAELLTERVEASLQVWCAETCMQYNYCKPRLKLDLPYCWKVLYHKQVKQRKSAESWIKWINNKWTSFGHTTLLQELSSTN
jgi:hypothetical protein